MIDSPRMKRVFNDILFSAEEEDQQEEEEQRGDGSGDSDENLAKIAANVSAFLNLL